MTYGDGYYLVTTVRILSYAQANIIAERIDLNGWFQTTHDEFPIRRNQSQKMLNGRFARILAICATCSFFTMGSQWTSVW